MTVQIYYRLVNIPHPWNEPRRVEGGMAWCLVREFREANGRVIDSKPVAIFDMDSEAELLCRFLNDGGELEVAQ